MSRPQPWSGPSSEPSAQSGLPSQTSFAAMSPVPVEQVNDWLGSHTLS